MGLFEYKCERCDNLFKIWKNTMPTEGQHNCNKCGHNGTPVFAASLLQFKGGGWYVNDSKKTEVALPQED